MLRFLTPADYTVSPWKNGLGTTTEIARYADGTAGGFDFDWRVSAADVVADGPFSTFPGIHRTIVMVTGNGMELQFADGSMHHLLPLKPFTFDGGIGVNGRLIAGPVRDFNVMVRRQTWLAQTEVWHSGHIKVAPVESQIVLAYVVSGHWHVSANDQISTLTPDQTLSVGFPVTGDLQAGCDGAVLLLVTLTQATTG